MAQYAAQQKPHALLRRLRWRRTLKAALVLGLVAGVVWADHHGWLLFGGRDWNCYHGRSFRVTKVVDNVTLEIAGPGETGATTRVRLWGVRIAAPTDTPLAQATRAWAQGARVRLELEPQRPRHGEGDLLAYVQLSDGTWLNERLLAAGAVVLADDGGECPRMERYVLMQQQAWATRTGVWASGDKSRQAKRPMTVTPAATTTPDNGDEGDAD